MQTSSYDISTGSGEILISSSLETSIFVQVVVNASLDADIVVKLKQTSDDVNYFDLADTTKTLVSGGDSDILESTDFVLNNCYVFIDIPVK